MVEHEHTSPPRPLGDEGEPHREPHHATVFEMATSEGTSRFYSLDDLHEWSLHGVTRHLTKCDTVMPSAQVADLPGVPIGRGPRGVALMGGRALIIAPISGGAELDALPTTLPDHPVDMVEWRADLYEPFAQGTTPSERERALSSGIVRSCELSTVPVLATIRTSAEGGNVDLDPREYAALVAALAAHADAVDIQIDTLPSDASHDEAAATDLVAQVHSVGAAAVASYHNFATTPDEDALMGRMRRMARVGADVAKIACRADGPVQALRIMNTQLRARAELRIPIIAIGMGHAAALTRIGGRAIGSAATFATIGRASAPGQFTAHDVREALDLLEEEHPSAF